jgi:hypothetical protein
MARRLKKIGPSRPGLGYVLPEGRWYYPLQSNYYPHHDDFLNTEIDPDEWAIDHVDTANNATVTFASSIATLACGTATNALTIVRLRSAMSAAANLYNIPFRVMFVASIDVTSGAGVAPPGGLSVTLGVHTTDEASFARFNFDLTTGSTTLAAPLVRTEVRAGGTTPGFNQAAAHHLFNTAANVVRSATSMVGYVIEVQHHGTWFGYKDDVHSTTPPRQLSFWRNPALRIDKNYYIDMRLTANGAAGFTQDRPVRLNIDSVTVEQIAPQVAPSYISQEATLGAVQCQMLTGPLASTAAGLATTGAGVFLGVSVTTNVTTGATTYLAVWDASAASTAAYDYSGDAHSAGARLLWIQQTRRDNSAGAEIALEAQNTVPAGGIPFFRGLLVGGSNHLGRAPGAASQNALVVYRRQQ